MLRIFFVIFSSLTFSLFAADYDCVFVGTSPIPLFEAIYQSSLGKKVLVLEESSSCGGVWKSIDICGISNVDMGCHMIGSDRKLADFLETYGGCKIVSFDNPLQLFRDAPNSSNGFYFSKGCFELIDHLKSIIATTSIDLRTSQKLESVSIDSENDQVVIKTGEELLSAKKIFMSYTSCFALQNSGKGESHRIETPHLYLLIADPTPAKFSYLSSLGIKGLTRTTNLTHFAGMNDTGRQLIVLQLISEEDLTDGARFLEALKSRSLVDLSAYILKSEPYIYSQGFSSLLYTLTPEQKAYFEILYTGNLHSMTNYLEKWKKVLTPYFNFNGHKQ